MYIYSIGVSKDLKMAKKWIKAAYENDIGKAAKLWEKHELWKY